MAEGVELVVAAAEMAAAKMAAAAMAAAAAGRGFPRPTAALRAPFLSPCVLACAASSMADRWKAACLDKMKPNPPARRTSRSHNRPGRRFRRSCPKATYGSSLDEGRAAVTPRPAPARTRCIENPYGWQSNGPVGATVVRPRSLPAEWWLGLSLEPGLFHDGHAGSSSAATTGT